jgi:hypothetical protein
MIVDKYGSYLGKFMWQLCGWDRVDICMTFHRRAFDFFCTIARCHDNFQNCTTMNCQRNVILSYPYSCHHRLPHQFSHIYSCHTHKLDDDKANDYVQWRLLIGKHRLNLVYWIFLIFDSVSVMS